MDIVVTGRGKKMPNNLISAELSQQLIRDDCKSFNIRKNDGWKEFVAIVRCKDCIHYYADPWGWGNCVFEGGVSRRTKESDFCSWGKRR